jgi:3-deoxy-D-manno-octulosonic acid kinase
MTGAVDGGERSLARWVCGRLPDGFRLVIAAGGRWAMVRSDLVAELGMDRFDQIRDEGQATDLVGRGVIFSSRLADGRRVLVRPYRHGGFFRRLTRDLFWSWPPRPFAELRATVEARSRGVPAAEILAAWVERRVGPFYRGWLVFRELEGAQDLWTAVLTRSFGALGIKPMLESAARSVAALHRRGVDHADLNLKNILVRRENEAFRSYIIDFDKARLHAPPLARRKAKNNLSRLRRSMRKLDPERRCLTEEDWLFMLSCYSKAAGW